jgi:hypothetical protein
MKIIVMDESRKKNVQICELLQKKKHKAVSCQTSTSFLEALDEGGIDRILLNVESWQRGRAMYKYFDVPARLGAIPVVFYNAPENFINITARDKNEQDRVLASPAEAEAVVESIA